MMAGGSNDQNSLFAQANAADDAATAAATQAQNSAAAVPPIVYTSSADKTAPVPQYYNPFNRAPSAPVQSPTLNLPGFQGVRNPFYSAAAAAPTQQVSADQAARLLSQYNTYRQGYADQLAAARAADQARLDAMHKAYTDKIAADKAAAEAAAAAKANSPFGDFGSPSNGTYDSSWTGSSYAQGGIAELMKGKK